MSPQYKELFESLNRRRRPEDIAQLILDTPEITLPASVTQRVKFVSRGSIKQGAFGFSSMSEYFAEAVGCDRQLAKGSELFPGVSPSPDSIEPLQEVDDFIEKASSQINLQSEQTDFLEHRLNREARVAAGLEITKRQYNKRFRFLRRLKRKRETYARELRKRSFTLISKSRLASRITAEDFCSDPHSAATGSRL